MTTINGKSILELLRPKPLSSIFVPIFPRRKKGDVIEHGKPVKASDEEIKKTYEGIQTR